MLHKKYVLGFAFTNNSFYSRVALIKKNKPDFMKGKLNGIGGKIESYDLSIYTAMVREFREETGVQTTTHDWQYFCSFEMKPHDKDGIEGELHTIYCFRLFDFDLDVVNSVKSNETEEVGVYDVNSLTRANILSFVEPRIMENIPMLLQLALNTNNYQPIEFRQ